MGDKVNRSWLLSTAGTGVALVVLAVVVDARWDGDTVLPSVLLELGSGALMAAVLFFIVPHFTRRVAEAVMDQMTAQGVTRSGGPAGVGLVSGDDGNEDPV